MRYTGKIPIPDLTKGMEMIPQAILARNKQAMAARKLQAEGIKAANKQYAEALGEVGGISQNVHPFAVPLVQEAYDHFRNVRVPELLAQNPATAKAEIAMEFQNFSNSVDKYLTNSDMMTAYAQYADYMEGPGNTLFDAKQKTLAADRMLSPSLEEYGSKRDYQMKGLLSGAHNVYNPDGSFSIMGLEIDPKTGQPRADMEIDLRTATHFNDPNWFTPSTVRMAPTSGEELARAQATSLIARNRPYDWERDTSTYNTYWQMPLDFGSINRDGEPYKWRLFAAENIIQRMQTPGDPIYNETAASMSREDLMEHFDMDPARAQDYPALQAFIAGEMRNLWDGPYQDMVKYSYKQRSSGSEPDDLRPGSGPASLRVGDIFTTVTYDDQDYIGTNDLDKIKKAYPDLPADLSAETLQNTDTYDNLPIATTYQALRGIRGGTMNDINANIRNPAYYQAYKLLATVDVLELDAATGLFKAQAGSQLPEGVAELITDANNPQSTQNIQGIHFTPDPNIYGVVGSQGTLVFVDSSKLDNTTNDLHYQLRLVLGQVFENAPDPLLALRRQAMRGGGTTTTRFN